MTNLLKTTSKKDEDDNDDQHCDERYDKMICAIANLDSSGLPYHSSRIRYINKYTYQTFLSCGPRRRRHEPVKNQKWLQKLLLSLLFQRRSSQTTVEWKCLSKQLRDALKGMTSKECDILLTVIGGGNKYSIPEAYLNSPIVFETIYSKVKGQEHIKTTSKNRNHRMEGGKDGEEEKVEIEEISTYSEIETDSIDHYIKNETKGEEEKKVDIEDIHTSPKTQLEQDMFLVVNNQEVDGEEEKEEGEEEVSHFGAGSD